MRISRFDILLILLIAALVYALVVGLARLAPSSGLSRLAQTTTGKLIIIICVVLVLCTAAFLSIVFIGC